MGSPEETAVSARHPRGGKYNAANPPINSQDAQSRLEEVYTAIHQIEGKLEFSSKDDFDEGPVSFQSWMSRATKALGYWRSERDFLERWIRINKNLLINPDTAPADPSQGYLEGDFDSRIEQVRLYIAERYTPKYSAKCPPSTMSALKKQKRSIQHILSRMESIFAGLSDAAKVFGVSKENLQSRTKEIGLIAQEANEELAFLIKAGRSMGAADLRYLLAILDRSVSEGFSLSSDEREQMDVIRNKTLLD